MNRAFIFPGQGSQSIKMGYDFFNNFSEAKTVFQTVDAVLGLNLSDVIFYGTENELTITTNAQPALMTVSMAILATITKLSGKKTHELCNYVAGHSLGEYSALCAAEVISLAEAALLLQIRSSLMQNALGQNPKPERKGAMAACLGISLNRLQETINNAVTEGVCQVANDNTVGQIVISGDEYNIDMVIACLKDIGFKAIKLKVSAAFHSELMKPAEIPMQEALAKVTFSAPIIPVISNITARPSKDSEELKQNLITQLCGTVKWRETMDELANLGVTELVEIGAGSVLTNLAKKTSHQFKLVTISSVNQLEEFLKNIA